jgi:hypothetical protein
MKSPTNGHNSKRLLKTVETLSAISKEPALSKLEQSDLTDCEAVIERGWQTFVEVGSALATIRENRLYRQEHPSFEAYCSRRWMYNRSYAYSLIAAAQAVKHLSAIADTSKPQHESQVRPLIGLPPDRMKSVWVKAVEIAQSKPVTAKHVRLAVAELNGEAKEPKKLRRKKSPSSGLLYVLELIEKAERSIAEQMGTAATLNILARIKNCVSEVLQG